MDRFVRELTGRRNVTLVLFIACAAMLGLAGCLFRSSGGSSPMMQQEPVTL